MTLNDITIDDSAGDAGALGHNIDAFDIGGSTGVSITGANVEDQDDCLAVNSGSVRSSHSPLHFSLTDVYQDITFTGGTCSGGHGLSIR